MITQLEIKNFRGFSEYKIEDVGQVNLLVGTNNCGKTSILEAVYLHKLEGVLPAFLVVLNQRGEEVVIGNRLSSESDLCRLFHSFHLTPGSFFSVSCTDHNASKRIFSAKIAESLNTHHLLTESNDILPDGSDIAVSRSHQFKDTRYSLLYDFNAITNHFETVEDEKSTKFIPASSLSQQRIVHLFNKVVLTPDEELVIDALKLIEPNIVRIASIGPTHSGILVKSSKWEERIPIGSFGDGIWRLLGLILSLVGAKNGTLLIDEIDTGLHHTVMSKMWKLICTTARKLNVQVFATTHSSDCWKTLADNAVEEEFADMPIRIHRINKEKESAVTFTNKEMHLALNRELEVR